MDLDGAKQDTGWRSGTDANRFQQFFHFGQPPAYGFTSQVRPTGTATDQLHGNSTGYDNYNPVKNRVAELLTNPTPAVEHLFPNKHPDISRNQDGDHTTLQPSLTNGSSGAPNNTFPPHIINSSVDNINKSQLHGLQSHGALYQSNNPPDYKSSVDKYGSGSKMESSSSLGFQNIKYAVNPLNHKQYEASTESNKPPIQQKSRNMAETSAIQHQNSPSFHPLLGLSQHQVLQNYSANDSSLNGEINSVMRNRSTSFESIHSDNSSRSSVHSVGSSQGKVGEREGSVIAFSHPSFTQQVVDGVGQSVAGNSTIQNRPASRSWSPWDNMIRSTNSSPATVNSTPSQPTSPVIRSSPVHSPFSSSTSSLGSLNMSISAPFIGGPTSPAVKDHPNQQDNTPKDQFSFHTGTKEMKPPDSLPKSGKPVKKKNSGKLKESRRKRGMPYPDDSLDEINPELARMIRESKAKEEMKKKKTDTNKKVKQLPGNPDKSPASVGSPLDRLSPYSNHDMNSVMKSASPYEFTDEPDDFSAGVLHNTLNTNINVNSKMYSMSEMLAMTNSRSDSVDTKIEVANGEVKVKKKKKKKTVEKMLTNPNEMENPYPAALKFDLNAKDVNLLHHANLSGNSTLPGGAYNVQPVDNSSLNILQSHNNPQVSASSQFLTQNGSVLTSGVNVSNVKDNFNVAQGTNNVAQQVTLPVHKETDTTANIVEFNTIINSSTLSNPSMCNNDLHSKISKLNGNNLMNSGLGSCECGSLNGAISPLCKVHNPQHPVHFRDTRHLQNKGSVSNITPDNALQNVDQSLITHADYKMQPACKNSANMLPSRDNCGNQNVLKNDTFYSVNMAKNGNVPVPKFSAHIIKSENSEMGLEKYLSGCNDPNTEGALLNNLEASIGNLFTKTFLQETSVKNTSRDTGNTGQLKRSSSWHDIHDMAMKAKKLNKIEKKNPLLDPNIQPTVLPKPPKIKKTKLHGVNGVNKNITAPIGPFASPEEERLDRLRNNRPEIPSCSCFPNDMMPGEADEGPYYTQLGSGKSIPSIREQLEKQIGMSGPAIRIEKVMYSGKEGKSPQGCPIAKWIIRRSGPDEKYLCVVKHRKGHSCDATYIIVVLVAWEGVPTDTADDLYSHLVGSLTKNGFETDRRCGTNEKKTCACQGVDLVRRGASFSFGCSWSMYFNGCKYARSREVRKFKLKDTSKEEELESRLQTLATKVGPLYEKVAPRAHSNQCEFKEGKECRLGSNELKPFSGVTACVDFCAHAHKDLHNMNNGSTVVVTLTKHRGLTKPDDEQLHVLPLYTLDPTDEHGSYDNQMAKVRTGALEILHNFPHEARMRAQPLTPKKKGKNAKKDQSPGCKKDTSNPLHNTKPSVPNLQLNGKLNKNSNHSKDKICKTEVSKTNHCPPVKFENKDNLTFDNLMSLSNMPGFSEIYASFWSFFYTNGSFPPSSFLEKFGAKLPANSVNIKNDVNNPSNNMMHKASAEMEQQNTNRQLCGNNVNSAQPDSFMKGYNDTQAITKNIYQSHPSQQLSANMESQPHSDLKSVQKHNFQEHQKQLAHGNSYPYNKDHIFKVPKTPDNGTAINHHFRSPEHPQQKTDWQRLPHHPISSLSQAEKENQVGPPPSPNYSSQFCLQPPLQNYQSDKQNTAPNNQLQSFYNQQHNKQYQQTFQNHQQQFSHNQFQPGQNNKQHGVNRQQDSKNQLSHEQQQHQQHLQQLQQHHHQNFQQQGQQLQQNPQHQQQLQQQQQQPMFNSYLKDNQDAHQRLLEQGTNRNNPVGQNDQQSIPNHSQPTMNYQSVHGYHYQPSQLHSADFPNHQKIQKDTSGSNHQGFAQPNNDKLTGDWQAAKRPCLSNDTAQNMQPNQNMVQVMQKVNNGPVLNQNHVSNGANIPSNTQNCLPLTQGRNFQMDLQNLPSKDNSQFNIQRNSIITNDQQNLPQHSPANCGQATIHSGSNLTSSQLSTPAKQSFESPLHMLSEAASVTNDSCANQPSNHVENRNTPTFPQFSNPVPCEPKSHFIKQSQENQHHQVPSMQNASKPQTSKLFIPQEHSGSVNCGHPPNSMLNNLQHSFDGNLGGSIAGNQSVAQANPDEPSESIIDPTVVHCQMEYNEESFHDPDVGGVAIALSHGAVLFEVAKRELHATTALKNPNRYKPTRISLVFYQHKNLNYPNHGFSEYELKSEKLRLQKLEKRKESLENGEIIPPELKMKKKKKKDEEEEIDFAKTSAAQYKFMWEAPVSHSHALTTDSIITRWIDPQPMVTGPYQRWVLPTC